MHTLEIVLVSSLLLIGFSLLQWWSKKTAFPYTILLLILGVVGQEIIHALGFETHLELSSDIIYYLLLPLLLFGAASHINIHQFKIQFKTITFLATFGLLLSIATITFLAAYLIHVPWDIALLFAALISATDPIAVLALFQTLGSPKRLALLADGESMLNDATAVVMFRILSAVIVTGSQIDHLTAIQAASEFAYVFIGSILAGGVLGYGISVLLAKIDNDKNIETTLAVGAALLAFTASEHYFHLSGVITAVVAGLLVGNLGRSRISPTVIEFTHDFWDYVSYIAVSLVFFFATYSLDFNLFRTAFPEWLYMILAVLVGRAVSVYVSFAIANHSRLFNDEPNVPMSWQHVMNWGGLRGVIPLVLIFSIPDTYAGKDLIIIFTFASLLFTLLINGSTIGWLLTLLKLNKPSLHEELAKIHEQLFDLETAIRRLTKTKPIGISTHSIESQVTAWQKQEEALIAQLEESSDPDTLIKSLKLQILAIEREVYQKLLERQEIKESVFFELEAQLDLQFDAVEYGTTNTRMVDDSGHINARKLFRQQLFNLRRFAAQFTIFRKILQVEESELMVERYMLIRSRLVGIDRAQKYIEHVKNFTRKASDNQKIIELQTSYDTLNAKNAVELKQLRGKIDFKTYDAQVLSHALVHHHSPWVT